MIVWSAALLVVFVIGWGALFGAPFLPTKQRQMEKILPLLNLKRGSLICDLGCGDGRFLLLCAREGYRAVGYEINPFWYLVSFIRTRYCRQQIKVIFGDFTKKKLPPDCKGVYVFLSAHKTNQLAKSHFQSIAGARVVSYAFTIHSKKQLKTQDGLHLYQY